MGQGVPGGGGHPKLLTLAAYRGEHPDALDADLKRLYGGTFRQLRREVTCREVAAFAANIPPDPSSAIYRAYHAADWWWTPAHEDAVGVMERLDILDFHIRGGKGTRPKPYPRPGDSTTVKAGRTFTSTDAFDQWRAQRLHGKEASK